MKRIDLMVGLGLSLWAVIGFAYFRLSVAATVAGESPMFTYGDFSIPLFWAALAVAVIGGAVIAAFDCLLQLLGLD